MKEKRGLRDLLDKKIVQGVSIWPWGDGWDGPYFDNELWVNLNEYVLRNWVKNPERSEVYYFNQYAKEIQDMDDNGAKDFRKLVMLATDGAFFGQQSTVVPVSPWWCRDHNLTTVNLDKLVKSGNVKECMAEKARAVAMWEEAEALSKKITLKDPRDTKFMRVSTTYGRIKYQIFEQLWRIQLLLATERIKKTPLDEDSAKAAVVAYDHAFEEWRQLKYDNPCCPTLYIDYYARYGGHPFQRVLKPLKKRLGIKH